MHQVQQGYYTSEMLVQHCLTTCMRATMVEPLSSVSKIRTANVMSKTESVPSLKTCVGWAWTGMKVLRRTKTTANQNVWNSIKHTSTNSWRKEKLTNLTLLKKSWQLNVNAKKRQVKHLVTLTNTLAWARKKKLLTLQNVKQRVWFQRFVWQWMSLVSTSGMIWSKAISSLKVVISVGIGSSRRKMATQLTTLPLWSMTTTCKSLTLSVETTTLPTPQNSSWSMKPLVGKHQNSVTWLWSSILKLVRSCLNGTLTPFNLSKITVRRATFQKQSLTSSLFLVGTLVGKTKSSLAKNSSSSLMNIVSASLQLLSTRRKWTGWAMSISRMRILRLSLKWPSHSSKKQVVWQTRLRSL